MTPLMLRMHGENETNIITRDAIREWSNYVRSAGDMPPNTYQVKVTKCIYVNA